MSWELYVKLTKREYESADATDRNQKLGEKLATENRSIKKLELDFDDVHRGWWGDVGSSPT